MHHRGLTLLIAFAAAVLAASAVEAQLSSEYADWEKGPAGFLLTKKEKKQWSKIKTDAEAKAFIELFWAKRNPEPTSSFNSFKAEFEQRVRYADEHFAYAKRRGATTDRGQAFILLGPPRAIHHRAPTDNVTSASTNAQITDQVTGTIEVWMYDPTTMPEGFDISEATFTLSFYEVKTDTNEFVLDRSNRETFRGLRVLSDAPEVYLLHEDMTEVPKPVSVHNGRSPESAELAWLGVDTEWNDAAIILAEAGVADATSRPLWVHIELPAEAPVLDLLVGQVKAANGDVESTFATDANPLTAQSGKAYHLTFLLAPGSYTVEIAGAAAGVPVVTTSIDTTLESIPDTGTWMSPLWMGVSAQPETSAMLGAPFSFGGWHVMPLTRPELSRDVDLAYFGFVVRPGKSADGAIVLEATVTVKKDGKRLGRPFTMPLDASLIKGDLYMYGNSVRLGGLPDIGEYELDFVVTDKTAGISVEKPVPLTIVE